MGAATMTVPAAVTLRRTAAAGLAGGAAMAAWLMLCGEIANEPTRVPGIDSSTWTALTGISAFFLGDDAFHGDWAPLSILFGLAVHLAVAAGLAAPGAAVIRYAFPGRVPAAGAAAVGFAYGLALEVIALNVIVNAIQADAELYHAIPIWGWWVGHACYGVTLGVLLAAGERRDAR